MQVKGIFFAVVTLLPGCASMQDCHYEATNALRSQIAWYHAAPNACQGLCPSDYGKGWRMGYYAVTMGGGSHPPSLPPREYWSAHYQSPAGQAEIAAWYRGYQDGAIRAERRGAGNFHYLHVHDSGLHGPGHVIEMPMAEPAAEPAVEPESIPAGTTSIHHSRDIGGDSAHAANAKASASPRRALSARVQPASPALPDDVAPLDQPAEPTSLMPADYFPAPPPVTSEQQPALMQPTSMQPLEEAPALRAAPATADTGIQKSSWTTVQKEAPLPAASNALSRLVQRLPPVRPPLFDPPAPDASTDKP
ncbi:MAG TPA: hypothetical protein VHV55_17860 [Pirellulales bacterium]|jgi:hypothetical protein|nr:hypothetical protein [Pirellulales bacterium]